MNTKMFILFFSAILTSIEGSAPRAGRLSRVFAGAMEKAGHRARMAKIKMRAQLAVQKKVIAFTKTEEFKEMAKISVAEVKEEVKEKCNCLQDHAKSPQIRQMMISVICMHIGNNLEQALQTKLHVTTTDVTMAVFQALHQYAQENAPKDKK